MDSQNSYFLARIVEIVDESRWVIFPDIGILYCVLTVV